MEWRHQARKCALCWSLMLAKAKADLTDRIEKDKIYDMFGRMRLLLKSEVPFLRILIQLPTQKATTLSRCAPPVPLTPPLAMVRPAYEEVLTDMAT
ncbi:uncharacterized protein MEPE_00896 [Melanopsichium pennsylvanicum]|uniref:Uncharacterized protein n=1 Tax=Melanopsichium pennsylvanicum TaxID=63383 RepID=A0AAJ4XGS5_9BASI|nr:uncharacterized protein MEPE_00896 [Melanopsichium pennsylvanicum]